MILHESLLKKILYYKNTNIIVKGGNYDILLNLVDNCKIQYEYNVEYKCKDNIFLIDIHMLTNKSELIELLKKICVSIDHFGEYISKKVIILLNIDSFNIQLFQKIRSFIDKTFMTSIFFLHSNKNNITDKNLYSRYIILQLPTKISNDTTTKITYKNIIKLLKKPLTNKSIESIREICYMYYMNHSDSLDLQKMIVEKIGSNLYLPNQIKKDVIEDITSINKLYSYSYRKPIFLECIIYSLFKHLENYTYNL